MICFLFEINFTSKEQTMRFKAFLIPLSLIMVHVLFNIIPLSDKSAIAAINSNSIQVECSNVENNQETLSIIFSYPDLDDKDQDFIIKSNKISNIDLNDLKNEIGDDNFYMDNQKKQIHFSLANLKKINNKKTLKIVLNEKVPTSIQICNSEESELKNYEYNPQQNNSELKKHELKESSDVLSDTETIEDNESPHIRKENSDWVQNNNLEVSKGKETIRNGKRIVQVMYFGSIHYALSHLSVKSAVGARPSVHGFGVDKLGYGRMDNITAAN